MSTEFRNFVVLHYKEERIAVNLAHVYCMEDLLDEVEPYTKVIFDGGENIIHVNETIDEILQKYYESAVKDQEDNGHIYNNTSYYEVDPDVTITVDNINNTTTYGGDVVHVASSFHPRNK